MSPPRYITPEGFARLAREHERIWTKERPRIVAEVEAAAALGDRSENAEYIYGKKKLRELDRRLRFLSERMDALTIVDPKPHPSGKAFFGAWVRLEDEDGEERIYRLVGPDEFDVAAGHISIDAPLGRGLIGHARGETVRIERPAGTLELTVLEVAWARPEGGPPRSPASPIRPPRRGRSRTTAGAGSRGPAGRRSGRS